MLPSPTPWNPDIGSLKQKAETRSGNLGLALLLPDEQEGPNSVKPLGDWIELQDPSFLGTTGSVRFELLQLEAVDTVALVPFSTDGIHLTHTLYVIFRYLDKIGVFEVEF